MLAHFMRNLHVTVFAHHLTAWIPSPMSDPRLAVAQFVFAVLGMESMMVLYTGQATFPE